MTTIERWTPGVVARHEAAHAIAAIEEGLSVEWAQVTDTHEFGAAVHIPDETIDWERDLLAVCVAMAAPSFVIVDRQTPMGQYARTEAERAFRLAKKNDLDCDELYFRAEGIVNDRWQDILLLADRLVAEGKVTFGHQSTDPDREEEA